jgi:hypothetical protein
MPQQAQHAVSAEEKNEVRRKCEIIFTLDDYEGTVSALEAWASKHASVALLCAVA